MPPPFRHALSAATGHAAIAYGYTLTVWSTGAVLMDLDGKPAVQDTFFFIAGAVAGFLVVELLATRGFRDFDSLESKRALRVGALLHVIAAGGAVGTAAVAGVILHGDLVWPVASFCATLSYLTLAGVQLWLVERHWGRAGR